MKVERNNAITRKIIIALSKELGSLVEVEPYESDQNVISFVLKYKGNENFESVVITLDRGLLEGITSKERSEEVVKQITEGFWKAAAAKGAVQDFHEAFPYLAIVPMEISKDSHEYEEYVKYENKSLPKEITGILVADVANQLNVIVESYCKKWNVRSDVLIEKVLENMKNGVPEAKLILEDLDLHGIESVEGREFVEAYLREGTRYLSSCLLYVDDYKELGFLLGTDKVLAIFISSDTAMYLDYNDPVHLGFTYVVHKMFDRSGLHSSTRRVYSIEVESGKIEYVEEELIEKYFGMCYAEMEIKN